MMIAASQGKVEAATMMKSTGHCARDKSISSEEPDEGKACPELAGRACRDPVEGSHVRFGTGGGWVTAPPTIIGRNSKLQLMDSHLF